MSTLNIGNKTYRLIGSGITTVPTSNGMKQALDLLIQNIDTYEAIKEVFGNTENAANIVIVDDDGTKQVYSKYVHLDGTITIKSDGANGTLTNLKLLEDDTKSVQESLQVAHETIQTLTQQLQDTKESYAAVLKEIQDDYETKIKELEESKKMSEDLKQQVSGMKIDLENTQSAINAIILL